MPRGRTVKKRMHAGVDTGHATQRPVPATGPGKLFPTSFSRRSPVDRFARSGPIGSTTERKVPRMDNPPEGGKRDNRKIVKKVLGWLTLQALGVWVRHLIDSHF